LVLPDVANEQVPTMPINRPKFRAHVEAHKTVINDERWFRKGEPFLGKPFTVKKTVQRYGTIIEILSRATKRAAKAGNHEIANGYRRLQAKLAKCRPHRRCGSLACPKCARAFQRAKVAAEETIIADLANSRPNKRLVFVTIIPRGMIYYPGQFSQINVPKANRWLKDIFDRHGIRRVILGSVDLGWEKRRSKKYLQLHWHLAMRTNNPEGLKAKLKAIFLKAQKHERPVDVKIIKNMGFLGYENKIIKLPKLLRHARRQLAGLSLVLDQIDPLDFLFLRKVRLSAQSDGIVLRRIKRSKKENVREES
jgi:hypothetical protein